MDYLKQAHTNCINAAQGYESAAAIMSPLDSFKEAFCLSAPRESPVRAQALRQVAGMIQELIEARDASVENDEAKSNTLGVNPFSSLGATIIDILCATCNTEDAVFTILDAGVIGGFITCDQAKAIGLKFGVAAASFGNRG